MIKKWSESGYLHMVLLAAAFLLFPSLLSLKICSSAQGAVLGADLSADSSGFRSVGLASTCASFLSRLGLCKCWCWHAGGGEPSLGYRGRSGAGILNCCGTAIPVYCLADVCLQWEKFSNLLGKLLF